MLSLTLMLLVLVVTSLWYYNKRCLSYWAERGISSPPALPFLGNFLDVYIFNQGRWIFEEQVYRNHIKNGLAGVYHFLVPVLYIVKPELIKRVLVKDFDHFTDKQPFKFQSSNKKERIINGTLASANGERWRSLRRLMTPTFTSGKVKSMFHLVSKKADNLASFCLRESAKGHFVDMKNAADRFTIDTIASCAFGIECNSLANKEAVFLKKTKPFFSFGFFKMLKSYIMNFMPFLINALDIEVFPQEKYFFYKVAEQTLAARRSGSKRGDFLDLLLEEQANEQNSSDHSKKQVLDDSTILSQTMMFIIVGYETTAITISFVAKMLSENLEAQQRLRQEMRDIEKENGKLTYKGVMDAKYLDACIMETLRIYPPTPTIERMCTKDYYIPESNLTVKKGHLIQIPIWSIQHDEKNWPEPEVFNPDRWMPENKSKIVPYSHMFFGIGPRNCIGMRFALMETKLVLSKLILAAEMRVAKGHEELKLSDSGAFFIRPKELNLVFEPLVQE